MRLFEDKYSSPAYWTQMIQLMIFEHIKKYLEENKLTKSEFAKRLGVSKGYVSQIMNGDFDHRLSKLVELALACGLVPSIELVPKEYAEQMVKDTYLQPRDWKKESSYHNHENYLTIATDMKPRSFKPIIKTAPEHTDFMPLDQLYWGVVQTGEVA